MSLTKTAKMTKTMRNIQNPIFLRYQKLRLARLILMQRGLRMILRLRPIRRNSIRRNSIRPKTIRPKKAHSTEAHSTEDHSTEKGPFDRRPIDRKKVEENLLLIAKQPIPTLPLTLTGYCDDLHVFRPDSLILWSLKSA